MRVLFTLMIMAFITLCVVFTIWLVSKIIVLLRSGKK
jgi:hypothetical protein